MVLVFSIIKVSLYIFLRGRNGVFVKLSSRSPKDAYDDRVVTDFSATIDAELIVCGDTIAQRLKDGVYFIIQLRTIWNDPPFWSFYNYNTSIYKISYLIILQAA